MKEFYIPLLPINLEKNTDEKLSDREVPGIELEYPWKGFCGRTLFTGAFVAGGKDGLAVSFCAEVPHNKLVARRTENKTKVYEDDCLEFFIMPGAPEWAADCSAKETGTSTPETGMAKDATTSAPSVYYAWEINPNNACLDYRVFTGDTANKVFEEARAQKDFEVYAGDEKISGFYQDTIDGLPLLFDYSWKGNAVRRITIEDDFWYLELFIPWKDLGLTEPPAPGSTWYGTINRLDAGARSRAVSGEKRSENPGLLCLLDETDLPSFHQPKKFAAFHFESGDNTH